MKRVALVYDNTIRPDTTGIYVERALRQFTDIVHFLPTQIDRIQAEYDLYLQIDDGLTYRWTRSDLHPSAWWIIDTHLQFDWDREKAVDFDFLFTAQKNGAQHFRLEGFDNVRWIPLGCDPQIHRQIADTPKQYNVCFVGNLIPGRRTELVELLKDEIPRVHVAQAFMDDMAKIYSQSKIVFNCSIKDDVNMRVFEAISCGSMLMTNEIDDNGQEQLFDDQVHYVTYTDADDLLEKTRHFLEHEEQREDIASEGMAWAHTKHMYRHRLEDILGQFQKNTTIIVPELYTTITKTSIVIVVCNVLEMTKQCINSVLEYTKTPFEIIIVDNGSSDDTPQYLQSLQELTVDGTLCGIKVVTNTMNFGFPKAVNQGIAQAAKDTEYILLLNNDTIVTPGYLNRLLRVFTEDDKIGIVGPGSNNCSGAQQVAQTDYTDTESLLRFANNFARIYLNVSMPIERLVGFCMLIKYALIVEIGNFDEVFGTGNFEDDDFCTRAAQVGWSLRIAGDVYIHHFGQQTFQAVGIDYNSLMRDNWQKYLAKYPDGGLHKEQLRQEQQTSSKNVQSPTAKQHPTVTN